MKYFLLLLCLSLMHDSHAQDTTGLKRRVNIAAMTPIPRRHLLGSTFSAYFLADSFSLRKDTVHASEYFLKVNPYHIMYFGQTPETIDSFLKKFQLTERATTEYKTLFVAAYKQPKTDLYEQLKAMRKETLKLKYSLDTSKFLKSYFEGQLWSTDSAHSDYLFRYTRKNGWPTIENGSLYAADIAARDLLYVYDYIPLMKKAYDDGQLPFKYLVKADHSRFKFTDFYRLLVAKRGHYAKYDLSLLLEGEVPNFIDEIPKVIEANCPLRDIFLVLETNRESDEKILLWAQKFGQTFSNRYSNYISGIHSICEIKSEATAPVKGLGQFALPTDYKKDRLILYIVYDR